MLDDSVGGGGGACRDYLLSSSDFFQAFKGIQVKESPSVVKSWMFL